MSSGIRQVVHPNPVRLTGESAVRREAPRPPELRQSNYFEQFDADTVFFDTVPVGARVALIGPPLLNLRGLLADASWQIAGTNANATLRDLYLTQGSWLEVNGYAGDSIRIATNELVLNGRVSPNNCEWFRSKRTLLTISKNNDLAWISDWARFYAIEHGVNAILLYDNASDAYTTSDILAALDIPEIDVAVVVSWPFRYGPRGGNWGGVNGAPWDSNFCQHGMFQHARYRFLAEAEGVLNHDIDELLLANNGQSAFEALDGSCDGVIYDGRWIENIPVRKSEPPRFTDFEFFDRRREPAFPKWLVDPRRTQHVRLWGIHQITDAKMKRVSHLTHRHFVGVSTHWKWDRSRVPIFDAAVHERDVLLVSALNRVFGRN